MSRWTVGRGGEARAARWGLGIGKTTVARKLLSLAADGDRLIQWIDVDALWMHQPWTVSETTMAMLHGNLHAALHNAGVAGVQDAIVTWAYQNTALHDLVCSLTPEGTSVVTVQLLVARENWELHSTSDETRPVVDDFYLSRYNDAQATPADFSINTGALAPDEVAAAIAHRIHW